MRDQAFLSRFEQGALALNFKPSRIKKYDGSTNPVEWLEMYQLAIEPAKGHSYVMANYLPIFISQDMAHGATHRISALMV
jgi:hypothetical protein